MSSIRRHVHIAAPSRAVWNAVTTAEGLASWWVDSARVDGRQGGRLVVQWTDDDGKEVEARGMFHEFRPTAQAEVLFDRVGDSPLKGCRLAFQVARDGAETRLSLVLADGEALLNPAAREALDAGWRRDLKALQALLDAP
jgi:uncharacterized protein YndB with AHSA1/START domain